MATLPSSETRPRIATLDIVRGIAVMGILAMNIVAFAMPPQAYINPIAYGGERAIDLAIYAFNFVFIDGKMRGLFSFLFGASMLLVIEVARAKGESAASITLRRQLWLLVFGMIHFYLIWYGDILIGYAIVGMAAWFFHRLEVERLVGWALSLITMQLFVMVALAFFAQSLAAEVAAGTADAAVLEQWDEISRDIAIPSTERLNEILALHLGPWTGVVHEQVTTHLYMPYVFTFIFGWETLGYMLLGMAALKSGLLTGEWNDGRYQRLAFICLAIAVPVYVAIIAMIFADGFTVEGLFTWSFAATVPFRPLMVAGYAALIILATRRGGWLVDRIAAAGRAAFTNYLGTSIAMTALFYGWGLGLYGSMGRAELWLVVIAAWAVMLAWSKPWLDRFAYGPFEWLWRSLARWEVQPMRRRLPRQSASGG